MYPSPPHTIHPFHVGFSIIRESVLHFSAIYFLEQNYSNWSGCGSHNVLAHDSWIMLSIMILYVQTLAQCQKSSIKYMFT